MQFSYDAHKLYKYKMRCEVDSRKTNPSLLASLPNDVIREIIPFGACSVINLARTGRRFRGLFTRSEEYPRALSFLKKLLGHAALGELEKAEEVWKLSADLLACRGTIYHPNRIYVEGQPPVAIPFHQNPGRYKYVDRTFYQILLMNSEFEEAEEVGKRMTQEEKQKQFAEVFPDGEIKKYDFDLAEAKKLLQSVFEAIAKDECLKIEYDEDHNIKNIIMSDSTQEALYKLYTFAKPKSEHEIGLVFDPEFYHEALKLYDEKCSQFKQKWDRYTFWNIRVEEWLAGCLGTGYLRWHSQGAANTTTRRGCVLADGSPYWPFRRPSHSIPGHHIFVGYYGGRRGGGGRRLRSPFKTYVEQKREQGQNLCGNIRIPGKRHA